MSFETTSNLLTLNNDPFPTTTATPATTNTTTASDAKHVSKLILRSALQKANAAVQCDSTNDVLGAINAYKEAISLLERVLSTVEKENDRQRLQSIHDSYSERIRLLSTITSKLETDMITKQQVEEQEQSPTEEAPFQPEKQETPWLAKKSSIRSFSSRQSVNTPSTATASRPSHAMMLRKMTSNRSSISSADSVLSSEDSLVEQPAMNLPSLKKKDHDTTPIPKVRSVFRARTSSLPKAPVMQRSSSMSTAMTIDTTPPSHSQTYPAQMIVNRPIISRPSVGGLGSMRKKAANRLSMDGFTISRAKEKLSNSPSAGSNTYGNFLKDHIQPEISLQDSKQSGSSHLKLLLALEKSMLEGAHITQRLYIPKSLWQQPNIRLSSMDIKVSACESLLTDIARLENWSYLDDLISSTRLLDHFETSVDHLQMTLSKKLKRDSIIESSSSSGSSQLSHSGSIHHSSSRDSISMSRMDSGKKTQSFMSWGTKLTKSVERMNAFSLTKTYVV
ncbi:hypothetical protein FB192DRAFT_1287248 [Mucor lusitanicus]|uniref:MIT domain-containing protein n=1 Tax=Mucor circinelloides f. lusitanicus TaxID=29924 RepID=A0A8H4EZA3_MUCCL|nr:hypothetical protein FB192DRAFT_1287248 [Mucor lusitanicus]